MKEKISIALISGGFAILGAAITQWFELQKRKSEENRWYADYFLPKKFDSISNLYAELQSTYGQLSVYHTRKLKGEDEYQELIIKQVNRLNHVYHLATIYLGEAENNAVRAFTTIIPDAVIHIATNVAPIVIMHDGKEKTVVSDWPENFDKLYIAAKDAVARSLAPKFLNELEQKFSDK